MGREVERVETANQGIVEGMSTFAAAIVLVIVLVLVLERGRGVSRKAAKTQRGEGENAIEE